MEAITKQRMDEVFGYDVIVSSIVNAATVNRQHRGCCLFGIASSGKTCVATSVCRRSGLAWSVVDCSLLGSSDAALMVGLLPIAEHGGILVLDGLDNVLSSQWAEVC